MAQEGSWKTLTARLRSIYFRHTAWDGGWPGAMSDLRRQLHQGGLEAETGRRPAETGLLSFGTQDTGAGGVFALEAVLCSVL